MNVSVSQERFLPFLDMFQKDSVRVEVCRSIMEVFIKWERDQSLMKSCNMFCSVTKGTSSHKCLSACVCLLQTPGGADQRPGHPQRHVAHLQDHARLCQVGYLFVCVCVCKNIPVSFLVVDFSGLRKKIFAFWCFFYFIFFILNNTIFIIFIHPSKFRHVVFLLASVLLMWIGNKSSVGTSLLSAFQRAHSWGWETIFGSADRRFPPHGETPRRLYLVVTHPPK